MSLSLYLTRPLYNSVKRRLKGEKPTINHSDLTENERQILLAKKVVAITQNDGYVFATKEKISSSSSVIIGELSDYLEIQNNLDSLVDKTPSLMEKHSIEDFYKKLPSLKNNTENANDFNNTLDRADSYMQEIEKKLEEDTLHLTLDDKHKHFDEINAKFELLKLTLTNAAIELGKIDSVWGRDTNGVTQALITDFNNTFVKGYQLNEKFKNLRISNSSSDELKKILEDQAKSTIKSAGNLWSRPFAGRLCSLGVSFFITDGIPAIYHRLFPEDDDPNAGRAWAAMIGGMLYTIFTSQTGITLIVDDIARGIIELREKKIPDIFNFCDGINIAGSDSKTPVRSGSEIRAQIKREKEITDFTIEIGKVEHDIEKSKEQLANFINLKDSIDQYLHNLAPPSWISLGSKKDKKIVSSETETNDAEFIKALNKNLRPYIYRGWELQQENEAGEMIPVLDENGKPIIEKLNGGKLYRNSILTNENTLKEIANYLETLIDNLNKDIADVEQSKDEDLFNKEEEGIIPGTIRQRTRYANSRKKELFAKENFSDYDKEEKKAFFNKISEAKITNNTFDLEALDNNVETFLFQLCKKYSDHSEKGFNTAVKQEFKEATNFHPTEIVMNAIEKLAIGFRIN